MSNPVIVYSTEDCVECSFVKKMLTEEGISFEVRDVLKSEEYQEEVEKFGFLILLGIVSLPLSLLLSNFHCFNRF